MNAHALHLPEERGVARWMFATLAILLAHATIIAAIALWYARQPAAEPNILPAITVSLAPVQASSPEVQNEDVAVGPTMQQADETPKEPPKVEEKPAEEVMQPTPQQQADVTLPEVQQKVEQPKPEVMPPAPETRAAPKNERVAPFSQAASNAYNALVFGHLQRFKRYPRALRGAHGTVVVQFVLDRGGRVIESVVTKSSGSRALDEEALDVLKRASPFPPFPAAKPGTQDSYVAPVEFSQSG
ncbi:energy transducer TonB [Bradyrhizobium sp.]|uniref:energy transducer TonB n=1 Tax=Bradyrhizobium sp. TaxID=376 RepID=UPI001ED0FF5A|nr:energy transducer TonB [Bradyrhizobium sp.]MBV9979822.1 energy transducer TonB [Bradyrhizobium sp.]